jgi:hypothetical protein
VNEIGAELLQRQTRGRGAEDMYERCLTQKKVDFYKNI